MEPVRTQRPELLRTWAHRWRVSDREDMEYPGERDQAHAHCDGKKAPSTLSEILADEMQSGRKGGIYHKIQVELTYNSNHIEGSRLTADQTRYIFETNTIGVLKDETVNVDDIIETSNHFRCIDLIIENHSKKLSETFIKELHRVLKSGTSDSRKAWFAVGDYKKQPNEVGGEITALPGDVHAEMHRLLSEYETAREITRGHRGIPREIREDTPVPGRKRPGRAAYYVQRVPAVWRRAVHHRREH